MTLAVNVIAKREGGLTAVQNDGKYLIPLRMYLEGLDAKYCYFIKT